ncbi:MAG: VWA domain-containing protein [Cytophagales bacterium]|nr:VWA domain-containing protein [Cytophagales bacterium]
MNWINELQLSDYVLISFFIAAYAAFIGRTIYVARKLHTSFYKVFIKVLLRSAYFVLFLLALKGPSFGKVNKEVKSIGKDIYIAVDLSGSMNARDVKPSRLDRVKFKLKEILKEFAGDRIGLIMFSSEAYVQCPLTYDKSALRLFVESLNTGLVPNAGTDFGPPLRMALEKITKEDEPNASKKSKVIILISDGEDHGTQTEQAAKAVEEAGIKLFTLGVGTKRGSKIPARRGFVLDDKGVPVVSKLNGKSLKELASVTHGKYFQISDRVDDTERLINSIRKIKGNLRGTAKLDVSTNKYTLFLVLGLLLLCLDQIISVRTIKL